MSTTLALEKYLPNIVHIPQIAFVKDTSHTLIASSNFLAQLAGYTSYHSMIGKLDSELCWAKHAEKYFKDDKKVLSGETLLTIEFINDASERDFLTMVKKMPVLDTKKNIIGILGYAKIIKHPILHQTYQYFRHLDINNKFFPAPDKYYCDEPTPTLTKAEFKVLFLYLRGFTSREIGSYLSRSMRTIESHIIQIKHKLNARNRREIFERAETLGYINFIPLNI